jgi:hypothetical protein
MITSSRISLLYYIVLLGTFDLCMWTLTQHHYTQALACGFVVALLLAVHQSMIPFVITISLYDMLLSGRCGFSCITMAPLIIVRPLLHRYVSTEAPLAHVIMWSGYYWINQLFYALITPSPCYSVMYTISHYCGTLVVLLGCLVVYKRGLARHLTCHIQR